MKRVFLSVLTLLFFIWLLPLGIFIKPSQEKIACDGQRAMCMCSNMQAKASASATSKGVTLKVNNSAHNHETASGGAVGHFFLAAHVPVPNGLNLSFLNREVLLAFCDPFLRSIEHIPKA